MNLSSSPLVMSGTTMTFFVLSSVFKLAEKQGPADGVTPVLTLRQSYLDH